MARIGRSHPTGSRYGGPVLVKITDPTSDQTTIGTFTFAASERRLGDKRRFPSQAYEGALTQTSRSPVKQAYPTRKKVLGPHPPQLIGPLPTDDQTMLSVSFTRTVQNRLSRIRRGPHSKLSPPAVVTAASTFVAAPVIVVTAADVLRRRSYTRRFPLQGWDEWPVTLASSFAAETSAPFATPILDNFNRADGGLGSNWVTPSDAFANAVTIVSNRATGTVGASGAHWLPTFPRDQEAYFTVPVLGGAGTNFNVSARGDAGNPATPDHLWIVRVTPDTSTWQIRRRINGAGSTVEATFTQAFAAGDSMGIRAIGAEISAWYRPAGGAWTLVGSLHDPQNQDTAGQIAISAPDTTGAVDDFGGGAVVVAGSLTLTRRRLGPFPPTLSLPLPTSDQTSVQTTSVAVRRRVRQQRYEVHSVLRPPAVVTAASTFIASPITVFCLQPDRLARRFRRMPSQTSVFPPTVLQTFVGPQVNLLPVDRFNRKHRRPSQVSLGPLIFYPQTSEISVKLVRTRPRPQVADLRPPTVLQTFSGPQINLLPTDRIGRRQRRHNLTFNLSPPAVVEASLRLPDRRLSLPTTLVRIRPKQKLASLSEPTTLQTFAGPQVNLLPTDRFNRKHRRGVFTVLYPPTVVTTSGQVFYGPTTRLVDIRPRRTFYRLQPPFFYAQTSNIRVNLVRTRPRPQVAELRAPTVLQAFVGPTTHFVQARPRPQTARLRPPTVLQTFAGPQVNVLPLDRFNKRHRRVAFSFLSPPTVVTTPTAVFYGPSVHLVDIRPRPIRSRLQPPFFYRQTSEIVVATVRIRPPRTHSFLYSPTALQVFAGPRVNLVRAQPRPTDKRLSPPTVIRVPSVEQQQQTIRVSLARIRPRPTTHVLSEPTALQVFAGPFVSLTKIRPRPTQATLAPPAVITQVVTAFYGPQVELTRQRRGRPLSKLSAPTVIDTVLVRTLTVALTKIRPRPTSKFIAPPTTLQVFAGPEVFLARARPRDTTKFLSPPTVVTSAAQAFYGPAVHVVRTRPRPIVSHLSEPIFYAQTSEILVAVTRIRPRPTSRFLYPPTTLQTFGGPRVTLTRTRPRPIVSRIYPPTVYAPVDTTVSVSRVIIRPRPTVHALGQPVVLQTFVGPRVVLTRIRPRPTAKSLFQPTKLLVPSIEAQLRTIGVKLVQTRPRPTSKKLRPPTVVISNPPVVTTLTTEQVALKTRIEQKHHFPLQGFRQRLIRETGAAAGIGLQGFDPLLGPRPPQIVDPLPTQREQTVRTTLAAVRTRVEQKRHFPLPGFEGQLVRETGTTAIQVLWRPLLGVRPPTVIGPLPDQSQQTIGVKTVSVRTLVELQRRAPFFSLEPPTVIAGAQPSQQQQAITVETVAVRARRDLQRRASHYFLTSVSYPATSQIATKLVAPQDRIDRKRRGTRWFLEPPIVVRVPSIEQQQQTIRVTAVRTRPRPTSRFLSEPTVLQTFTGPEVSVTRIRPRPITTFLVPPQVLSATPVVTQTKVVLTRTRPRPTSKKLFPPTFVNVFQARKTSVSLVRTRPGPTTHFLRPPTVLIVPSVEQRRRTIQVTLIRTRPQPTVAVVRPPAFTPPLVTRLLSRIVRTRPRPTTKELSSPTVVNRFTLTRGTVVQTTRGSTVTNSPSSGTVTATTRGSLVESQQSESQVDIGIQEGTVESE